MQEKEDPEADLGVGPGDLVVDKTGCPGGQETKSSWKR